MPIFFADLLGLALGAALAWVAAPELGRSDGPFLSSRPFTVVLVFATFVWLPIVAYFVAFHGDWSYLYLVPRRQVPSAIDLALVLLAGATVVMGFCVAVGPVRRHRLGPVLGLIVTPGGVTLAALPFTVRRLAVSGTYAQFHGDFGIEPFGASLLGKGVLLMGIVLVSAVAWTVRSLTRMAADGTG
jgi:hypothetical protein